MISIIIIVKNDREIENTLHSLNETKKPEKTEIIVIDASKKETLLDIKKKFPNVRWFYYENKTGKKITIPEQRNMGIKKSKGDILVFIDAGCIADIGWLVKLTSPIIHGRENVTAGKVNSIDKKNIHNQVWDKRTSNYILECGCANLSFKRRVIKDVGLFDETFSIGEDIDLTYRMNKIGYKINYIPSAIVFHNWGGLYQEINRGVKYGEASVNLYKKHKDKLKNLFKLKENLFTFYVVGFFFYTLFIIPLSIFWPYYSLFLLIPFLKNIRNQPIKKMIFDFFWGYGVIKRLFEIIFLKQNETPKSQTEKAK